MDLIEPEAIRNVALIGQGGSGKNFFGGCHFMGY